MRKRAWGTLAWEPRTEDIEELRKAIDDLTYDANRANLENAADRREREAQQSRIVRLEAAVEVMGALLAERGMVDAILVASRIDAAIRAREPAPDVLPDQAQAAMGPYRGAAHRVTSQPPPRTGACVRCGRLAAVSDFLVTEYGNACTQCHDVMRAED